MSSSLPPLSGAGPVEQPEPYRNKDTNWLAEAALMFEMKDQLRHALGTEVLPSEENRNDFDNERIE